MKKEIPTWSVVVLIAAALGLVAVFFMKNGTGDASKEELAEVRGNMQRMSQGGGPSPTQNGNASNPTQ